MSSNEQPNQKNPRPAPLTAEERRARNNERSRIWHKEHPREDRFSEKFRATRSQDSVRHMQESRKRGKTSLVLASEIQKVENYAIALQDNFDGKKWVLHHKLENEFTQETLAALGLYFFRYAKELIWLPAKEHKSDASIGRHRPDESKWHKKKYDRYGIGGLERIVFILTVRYLEDFGLSFENAYKNFVSGKGTIEDVIRWLTSQLHFQSLFNDDIKRLDSFLTMLSESLPFVLEIKGLIAPSSDPSSDADV